MSPIDPVEWVSPSIIRKLFNDGQYYHRVLSGQLTTYIKADTVLKTPPDGELSGTRSQIVIYYDLDGQFVAIVHQYLRLDGTLGASGKPDPKKLFHEGRMYAAGKESQ
jgi:hypothetical protein